MKSLISAASVLVFLSLMAAGAQAGVVNLVSKPLAELTSEGPVGGGDPLLTPIETDILHAQVLSQAYPYTSGGYVYFYQLNNIGTGSDSSIEMLTLATFVGAGSGTDSVMGWVSGDVPAGFLSGDQEPESTGYMNAQKVASFYFTERFEKAVDPGETSMVLYAVSMYAPGTIVGNLIGARVGSGNVIGPVVPEPSTLVLIGVGLAALFVIRRRKA